MIKVYGKSGCSFCEKTKVLCELYELEYEYLDATVDEWVLDFLIGNDFKSVPQIFIDGKHIGGYTEFYEHICNQ